MKNSSSQCLRFRNSQFVACATILPKTWIAAWTLEGQAKKSHSSRLLKWILDCSSNTFFWNSEAVAEPFDALRFEASRTSGFERCLILSHLSWIWTTLAWMSQSLVPHAQPKQIHPRLQCQQPSTYQVHGLSVPAVDQKTEKLNICAVIRSDLFWFICCVLIPVLECHLLILYNLTVSYCHWLLLFKGSQKSL